MTDQPYADRHTGVQNLMQWLTPNPNLPQRQLEIALNLYDTAQRMLDVIPDGPELTEGLRKLLEAKDCLVRASFPQQRLDQYVTSPRASQ